MRGISSAETTVSSLSLAVSALGVTALELAREVVREAIFSCKDSNLVFTRSLLLIISSLILLMSSLILFMLLLISLPILVSIIFIISIMEVLLLSSHDILGK